MAKLNVSYLLQDLTGARDILGQAQTRCKNGSPLWDQIAKLYDEIDSLHEAITEDSENYYAPQIDEI